MATITASKWGVTVGGPAATHDSARDAASSSSVLVNPTTNNGRDIEYYSYAGGKGDSFEISRTFLYFDTSSVTSLDNLVLKIDGVTNATGVKVMKATAFREDGSIDLTTGDHGNVTWNTPYDSSGTTGETWSTGSTVSITLDGSSGQAETDAANNNHLILAIVTVTDYLDFSVTYVENVAGIDWATTTPYIEFDDLTPSYEISNVFTKSTSSISTIIGKSLASISKFYDVSLVDTEGSPPPSGTATTYISADFSDQAYTNTATLPTGWREMTTSDTVWDSQLQTLTLAGDWRFDYNNTGSSGTGPNGGLTGGVSATTGTQSNTNRYLYIETSASHSGPPYSMSVITLPSLDFTNSLSNSTLKLTFWFHMYGNNNNNTQYFGVAATTSQTDASSASEVVTGSGFTSENGGGLDITYWTNDTGTTTSTLNRISGQQQTSSTALWRKAEVDLNDLAGEATVYLHFMISNVRHFRCDFAVDGVLIEGEE
jgi:hypothetical protein